MIISSRTPEGEPHRCPVCGDVVTTEPSLPLADSTCPQCGAWLVALQDGLNMSHLNWTDETAKLGDSIELVELVMQLEEKFDLNLPEDEAQQIQTIADLIRFLRKHEQDRGND